MKSRPTLKDIAAELNVSHPTVSRALADHDSISDEMKAKVREAARRLGYVANSSARMLRRGHTDVIGLLLPDLTNEFYGAVATRVADDCSHQGRQMVLSISAGDPDRELALVRALLESRPSGLIVALSPQARAETIELLRGTSCVQFLVVHPRLGGPSVTVEDSGGARQAIEHLVKLGHRRIGFVGPSPTLHIGEARLRGVQQALKQQALKLDDRLVQLGPSTAEFGHASVSALLDLPQPPTALYLSTAQLSHGGLRAIAERRLQAPRDLSVVVAGNAPWYEFWPGGGLTSITLPMAELADAASALVMRKSARRGAAAGAAVQLAFDLFVRGSTGPAKKSGR
jgi:LacI family transcriptional regulator